MTLESGTRLGPYAIVAPLGASETGEVYQATATRLNRTVAITLISDAPLRRADRPGR